MQKTNTLTGNYTNNCFRTRFSSVNIDYHLNRQCSLSLMSEKVSVNTGRFIPGQYRVNPYLVWSESKASDSDYWVDVSLHDMWGYFWTSVLSGDHCLALVDFTRTYAPPINPNYSNFGQRALYKAFAKVGSNKANLGETLGEFHETLSMFGSPLKSLRDFLLGDKAKNLNSINKLLKYLKTGTWRDQAGRVFRGQSAIEAAANTWLEVRYGWTPLVLTVLDLVELLQTKAVRDFNPDAIRSARANVKAEVESYLTMPSYKVLDYTTCYTSGRLIDKYRYYGTVSYKMSSLPTMSDKLGVSLKFAPELAWELTRLSFVVDWWFDVGKWLARWRVQPEIQILGAQLGIRVDREISAYADTIVTGYPPPLGIRTPRGKVGSFKTSYYERRINQVTSPIPPFKIEYHSWIHAVDALSLILQPVLGKLRR